MKKVMIRLFYGLMAILFVISSLEKVSAQSKVRFGLKGGVNFADMKYEPKDNTNGMPNSNSLTSYHIGLVADMPLTGFLSVQPGVMLNSIGTKAEYKNSTLGDYTMKVNPVYVDIPVNLLFKAGIGDNSKFYIGAGPYLGYGVSGKVTYSADTPLGSGQTDHDIKFGNGNGDDLKSADIGGNILAGFEFNNLLVGAQYGLSFTNNAPGGSDNASKILRNKVLSFSVGILF